MRCKECHFDPCRLCHADRSFQRVFHKAAWPKESDAAGVHPSQVPEAMEEARKLGTSIEFTKNGSAIFQSLAHQREYCRKIGLTDISKREITSRRGGLVNHDPSVGPSRH
jgi:hypothetical protein